MGGGVADLGCGHTLPPVPERELNMGQLQGSRFRESVKPLALEPMGGIIFVKKVNKREW